MKKFIYTICVTAFAFTASAQKLELTEAAVTYTKEVLPIMLWQQQDKLIQSKNALLSAKEAIDESYNLQQENNKLTKSKDLAKLYYYRGAIYLDYTMLSAFDEEVKKDVEANGEVYTELALESMKKSLEISDLKQTEIEQKLGQLRAMMLNGGVEMFKQEKYEEAYGAFSGAVEMSEVLGNVDTLAMFNAGLAADNIDKYDEAVKYYTMAADNGYLGDASVYQNAIQATYRKNGGPSEESYAILKKAKEKYPSDINLIIEEFNYHNAMGNTEEAQKSLQTAIDKDPNNPIFHYNIGATFDRKSNELADAKEFEKAQVYTDKAKESYNKALELDPKYADAYYNLGVLYNNEYYNITEKVKTISDTKIYEAELARGKDLLKEAYPVLEKANELAPTDAATLELLKKIYFTLEMMDEYSAADTKLKALGQ